MGLYDSFSLNVDSETAKKVALLVGTLLVLMVIGWFIYSSLSAKPLQVNLSGMIDLSTTTEGFPKKPTAELTITVSNLSSEPVQNVSVFVKPQDEKAIVVFPSSIRIDTLDKSRTVLVSIRPNPIGKVLSGTYQLEVSAVIGNQTYSQNVEVEIKNPETQQTQ